MTSMGGVDDGAIYVYKLSGDYSPLARPENPDCRPTRSASLTTATPN